MVREFIGPINKQVQRCVNGGNVSILRTNCWRMTWYQALQFRLWLSSNNHIESVLLQMMTCFHSLDCWHWLYSHYCITNIGVNKRQVIVKLTKEWKRVSNSPLSLTSLQTHVSNTNQSKVCLNNNFSFFCGYDYEYNYDFALHPNSKTCLKRLVWGRG